jgi:hypothetical protein
LCGHRVSVETLSGHSTGTAQTVVSQSAAEQTSRTAAVRTIDLFYGRPRWDASISIYARAIDDPRCRRTGPARCSSARREAILSAREILAAAIRAGQANVPDAFVISDEGGRALDTVPLAEVLPEALKK